MGVKPASSLQDVAIRLSRSIWTLDETSSLALLILLLNQLQIHRSSLDPSSRLR